MAGRDAAGRARAGSASRSSGTWGGCTTRSTYFARDPIHRPLPPGPAHLRDALRVQRALRDAAVARRGRAPQELAAREDAGRRLAEVREPARCCSPTSTRARARSCCSWARSSRRGASGTTTRASTGTSPSEPRAAGSSLHASGSARSTASARRSGAATTSRRGFQWIDVADREQLGALVRAPRRRRATSSSCSTSRPCRASATASACRRRAVHVALLSTTTGVRRQRLSASEGVRRRRACPFTASAVGATRCRRSRAGAASRAARRPHDDMPAGREAPPRTASRREAGMSARSAPHQPAAMRKRASAARRTRGERGSDAADERALGGARPALRASPTARHPRRVRGPDGQGDAGSRATPRARPCSPRWASTRPPRRPRGRRSTRCTSARRRAALPPRARAAGGRLGDAACALG